MKRKCNYCGILFSFKVEQLRIPKNQDKNKQYKKYIINCPFCYTVKEIFYNHIPRHLKENTDNKYLISRPRKSRMEIIKSTKETIGNNNDILDKILSERIVHQLVSGLGIKHNYLYYFIIFSMITLICIGIIIIL